MSYYVDSGYVDQDYFEGDAVVTSCDLMPILSAIEALSLKVDNLDLLKMDSVGVNVLPYGAKVQFMNGNAPNGLGIIRGSRFIPKDKYTFDLIYDVELFESNPARISSIPSLYIYEYVEPLPNAPQVG